MLDGYQAGADQYIGKPFNVSELLMRIKAILRRVAWSARDRLCVLRYRALVIS